MGLRAGIPQTLMGVLLPGMYVHARADHGRATAKRHADPSAGGEPRRRWAGDGNGGGGRGQKAEPRMLTLGPARGAANGWVTGGLKPGERVIVEGLQKVRPGGAGQAGPLSPRKP